MKFITPSKLTSLAAAISLISVSLVGTATASAAAITTNAEEGGNKITNDAFWRDTDGKPLFSQGGGIFDFPSPESGNQTHYWYGVRYSEAVAYEKNPTSKKTTDNFEAVTAYSSQDLVNWKYEGDVLTREEVTSHDDPTDPSLQTGWLGRTGVAYVPELQTYALFIQHEYGRNSTPSVDKQVLIATADSPIGPFSFDRRINMKDYNLGTTNTGDQSVFTDTDGKSYLNYSYGSGRGSIWLAQIGAKNGRVDLLTPTKIYQGAGREGNTMFTHAGRYYMTASDLHGWNSSPVHYLEADNVWGPYTPTNKTLVMKNSDKDYAHVSQTGFHYTLHGSEQDTVIYAGDRWAAFAGNGLGFNQWNPISFDGTEPLFNSFSEWTLDHETGLWEVGSQNNWVLNPSFEADRIAVNKVQGWDYSGDPGVIKNEADKDGRVGNFHMAFSKPLTSYTAKLSQTIKVPEGIYTLRAEARAGITSSDAEANMYADTSTDRHTASFKALNGDWGRSLEIRNIAVTDGEIEIGFQAENVPAKQWINFDDVSLIRQTDSDASLQSVTVAGIPVDLTTDPLRVIVPSNREVTPAVIKAIPTSGHASVAVTIDDSTISVKVTPEYGPAKTHVITIIWQDEVVAPTGVEILPEEVWLSSDHYSTTNPSLEAPTVTLETTVLPLNATDTSVRWESSNEAVAAIDTNGTLTGGEPGRALVAATTNTGDRVATATVNVPLLSESFANRDVESTWILEKVPAVGGTMSGAVATDGNNHFFQIEATGSGLRAAQLPLSINGDRITVAFDLNVGAPAFSHGAYVTLSDSLGNRYLSLQTNTGEELSFTVGGNDAAVNEPLSDPTPVGIGFDHPNAWYHVHVTIDATKQTLEFTASDTSDPLLTATHQVELPDQDYNRDLGTMGFWMTRSSGAASWAPRLDNFNIYALSESETNAGLQFIRLTEMPTTVEYSVGSELDLSGLEITGYGFDRVSRVLEEEEYTVEGFDSQAVGDQTLTVVSVADPNLTAQFPITVYDVPTVDPNIVSIAVSRLPDKTMYQLGEAFDASGIEIMATLDDDNELPLLDEHFIISGHDPQVVGDQMLTVTLRPRTDTGSISTSFMITVVDEGNEGGEGEGEGEEENSAKPEGENVDGTTPPPPTSGLANTGSTISSLLPMIALAVTAGSITLHGRNRARRN